MRMVSVFGAPPVPGIGIASGFKLMVEDRGALGLPALQQNSRQAGRQALAKVPGLVGVFTHVPLEHAAVVHGHRPHQGPLDGRDDRRPESDACRSISARST